MTMTRHFGTDDRTPPDGGPTRGRLAAVVRVLAGLLAAAVLAADDLVTAVCGAAPLLPRMWRAAVRARRALADRYRAAQDPDVIDAEVIEDTGLRRWI